MRVRDAVLVAMVGVLWVAVAYAQPGQYAIPAYSRIVYELNAYTVSNNSNVYVVVQTDENAILDLLGWADEYNLCALASTHDWYQPIVTYSSAANSTQRFLDYAIVEAGQFTFSNCYDGPFPLTVYYPKRISVSVGQLDTYSGVYQGFKHYIYVYQPYPLFSRFPIYNQFWSSGCRDIHIPISAISDPTLLFASNITGSGSITAGTITFTLDGLQYIANLGSTGYDLVPKLAYSSGAGFWDIQTLDRFCYSGSGPDLYLIIRPRVA